MTDASVAPVGRPVASVGAGALLALLVLVAVGCPRQGVDLDDLRAPDVNVLLITIDTLRADHLGSYGYERQTTPSLDALARRGVRFEAAFSPRGLTFPAVASIMTSKHVYSHGVIGMYKTALPDEQETLAEMLRERGRRTVGFTAHPALTSGAGFAQGFDEYFVFQPEEEPEMYERAAEWLARERQEPFFAWVHSFGPHSPYQAPEPWGRRFADPAYAGGFDGAQKPLYDVARSQELSQQDREHIIALYDGKLAWVDHHLGGLLEKLAELGLDERTLLVVTADHGEELFDHFLYFSHEASVYDGVLRVPLLLSLPGRLPKGETIRQPVVEVIDVLPTVLDVLGSKPPGSVQGRSLLPLVAGLDDEDHDYAYGTIDHRVHPRSILAIRSQRWRYIYNPQQYVPGAHLYYRTEELYDVLEDRQQQRNVAADHPEVAARLRGELERWAAWAARNRGTPSALDDPELEERLRALGYLDDVEPPVH